MPKLTKAQQTANIADLATLAKFESETTKPELNIVNSTPTVTAEDVMSLTGTLMNGQYPTVKGKLVLQILQNTVFSAYMAYGKSVSDTAPIADMGSALADIEQTCNPFKDGIDATFSDAPVEHDLAGRKPRAELIEDLIRTDGVDPEKLTEFVSALRQHAFTTQVTSLVKKSFDTTGGRQGFGQKIAAGMALLEETDESWDEAWITNSAEFVCRYTDRTFSPDDIGNLGLLKAILNGMRTTEAPEKAVTGATLSW